LIKAVSSSANTNAAVNTDVNAITAAPVLASSSKNAINGSCDHEEQRRLWFGIIERQATPRSYQSGHELIAMLRRFISGWNDRARPSSGPQSFVKQ
jgi:hypothetical protein